MGIKVTKQTHTYQEEKEANQISGAIDKDLQKDKREDSRIKKLLLLGAGESGKSTLFKQMINIYGKGYSEEDKRKMRLPVFNSTTQAMKELLVGCDKLYKLEDDPTEKDCYIISEENNEFRANVQGLRLNDQVSKEVARWVKALWADPAIQKAFENSNRFQLIDTCDWFMEHIDRISEPGFVPTVDDILRTRVRTTGIIETDFTMEKKLYKMVDVGGQRNERKKWIHCFDGVTAVIFVAAISGFNQTIFEDDSTNRLMEGLNLFEEYCNQSVFDKTSMILFLNKKDLFDEKIKHFSLSLCFEDYYVDPRLTHTEKYDHGTKFLIDKFQGKNTNDKKTIYTHVTCATDKNNIRHVFDAVRHIVVTRALDDGGFMW